MKKTTNFFEKTISLDEFSKDFTEEQNKIVENEVRYYYVIQSLKKERTSQGLSQEELAQKAKLPRTTITKVESGRYNPTIHTLMTIASAMNKQLRITLI